jgi:hypothetical protein
MLTHVVKRKSLFNVQTEENAKKTTKKKRLDALMKALPTKLLTVEFYSWAVRPDACRCGITNLCHEAFRSASQD